MAAFAPASLFNRGGLFGEEKHRETLPGLSAFSANFGAQRETIQVAASAAEMLVAALQNHSLPESVLGPSCSMSFAERVLFRLVQRACATPTSPLFDPAVLDSKSIIGDLLECNPTQAWSTTQIASFVGRSLGRVTPHGTLPEKRRYQTVCWEGALQKAMDKVFPPPRPPREVVLIPEEDEDEVDNDKEKDDRDDKNRRDDDDADDPTNACSQSNIIAKEGLAPVKLETDPKQGPMPGLFPWLKALQFSLFQSTEMFLHQAKKLRTLFPLLDAQLETVMSSRIHTLSTQSATHDFVGTTGVALLVADALQNPARDFSERLRALHHWISSYFGASDDPSPKYDPMESRIVFAGTKQTGKKRSRMYEVDRMQIAALAMPAISRIFIAIVVSLSHGATIHPTFRVNVNNTSMDVQSTSMFSVASCKLPFSLGIQLLAVCVAIALGRAKHHHPDAFSFPSTSLGPFAVLLHECLTRRMATSARSIADLVAKVAGQGKPTKDKKEQDTPVPEVSPDPTGAKETKGPMCRKQRGRKKATSVTKPTEKARKSAKERKPSTTGGNEPSPPKANASCSGNIQVLTINVTEGLKAVFSTRPLAIQLCPYLRAIKANSTASAEEKQFLDVLILWAFHFGCFESQFHRPLDRVVAVDNTSVVFESAFVSPIDRLFPRLFVSDFLSYCSTE